MRIVARSLSVLSGIQLENPSHPLNKLKLVDGQRRQGMGVTKGAQGSAIPLRRFNVLQSSGLVTVIHPVKLANHGRPNKSATHASGLHPRRLGYAVNNGRMHLHQFAPGLRR